MPVHPSRRLLLLAMTAAPWACGPLSGGRCLAGPLDLKALPATTATVVHVDVEAMMKCEPFRQLGAESLRKMKAEQLPIDLQKDILDVTAIENSCRIRLSPTARKRIEDYLGKLAPDQVRLNYGRHAVNVFVADPPADRPAAAANGPAAPRAADDWTNLALTMNFDTADAIDVKNLTTYVAFADDQTLLVAYDVRVLTRLLDVVDGKAANLADKGGDIWKARAKAPEGTWITSIGMGNFLPGERAADTPVDGPIAESVASVARDIKGGWCYVGESRPDHLFAECHVETAKPDAARQAKALVDGFKALMLFSDDGDARFWQGLESTVEGNDAILKWRCPMTRLADIMQCIPFVYDDGAELPAAR